MTDITEIKVPDITPSTHGKFIIVFYYSDEKPVANTEFSYTVDTDKTRTGQTEENGVLKVMVKRSPPQKIALSLPA